MQPAARHRQQRSAFRPRQIPSRFKRLPFHLALMGAALGAAGPARADTASASAARDDNGPVELETVTVKGDKAGQDLQRTYSGVSVIDSQQIEDLQIRDVRSSFQLLPNVNASPSNRGNNGITIRGLNSEGVGSPGINPRPMAALVIDGATQSFEGIRRGARGLWDVDQVEVYRGPQATLQGRNALAGAVVIKTKDPTPYWEGAAQTSFAHFQQRSEAIMLSGPILENELAFRLTHESIEDSHGLRYVDPSLEGLDDGRFHNTRFKLLLTPSRLRDLSVKFTYSDSFDRPAVTAVNAPYSDRIASDLNSSNPEVRRNKVRNQILDVSYAITPSLKLSSVTSAIDTRNLITAASPTLDLQRAETRTDGDVTQDLRLAYDGGSVTVFSGYFYGRFRGTQDSYVSFLNIIPVQDLYRSTAINVHALYSEVNWKATERLSFIIGARQEIEKTWIVTTFRQTIGTDHIEGTNVAPARRAKPLLPKLGVAYDLVPGQTLALTVSEGYRSGFTDIDGSDVRPESLMHYEAAYRGRWLDGQLVTNLNLFQYDFDDQQVSLQDPTTRVTRSFNAEKSRLKGAELQVALRPAQGATVGMSFGLLKTQFLRFEAFPQYVDKEFPEAPRRSASLWGSYHHPSGLFAAADASYKSGFYGTSDLANEADKRVPGYALVNLRIGYETDHWAATLFCNNLLDRDYIIGRDNAGSTYVGDPRIVGMTLSARF